jgi:hypothetical protein
MNSWILLLYGLPTKQNAGRLQLWRKLKKFGALQLKTSAYVLPDEPKHYERFQWLATQVRSDGGEATLIKVSEIEGLPYDKVVQLFNDARTKDYTELTTELLDFVRTNKKRGSETAVQDMEKLQARYHELQEMDYFNCPKAQDAQMVLRDAGAVLQKKTHTSPKLHRKNFSKRQWLTRPHPQIDRVGSAWLIRKFIDPEAIFIFSTSTKAHPDGVPYDMFDVEFTHHGDDCTFETLVKRFSIEDAAVQIIAEMVHDADLEDEKFKRNECFGIDIVLKGYSNLKVPDEQILVKGFEMFDALYAALKRSEGIGRYETR